MVRSLTDRLSAFLGRAPRPPVEDQEPRERCLACGASLADTPLYEQYRVCPSCRFHYNLTARERVSLLADPSSFRENHRSIVSLEPAASVAPSEQRPRGESRRTGLTEAAITGRCSIGGRPVVLIVLDFRFVGGTIGAVVGEKVSLAFELATRRKIPVVAVVTSGTTGIQEGVISPDADGKGLLCPEQPWRGGPALHHRNGQPHHRTGVLQLRHPCRRHPGRAGLSPGTRACAVFLGRLPESRRLRHSQRRGAPGPRDDRPDNRQGES